MRSGTKLLLTQRAQVRLNLSPTLFPSCCQIYSWSELLRYGRVFWTKKFIPFWSLYMDPICLHINMLTQVCWFTLQNLSSPHSIVCSDLFCSQSSWFSSFSFWLFGFCVLATVLFVPWSQWPGDFLSGADAVPGVCSQVSCVAVMRKWSQRQLPGLPCQWGALGCHLSAP